jgi:hypothetical protein
MVFRFTFSVSVAVVLTTLPFFQTGAKQVRHHIQSLNDKYKANLAPSKTCQKSKSSKNRTNEDTFTGQLRQQTA